MQGARSLTGSKKFGGSISARLRNDRWMELIRRFPDLREMRVIDLGGTTWDWTMGFCRAAQQVMDHPFVPKQLLVVNLDPTTLTNAPTWMSTLVGDACELPHSVFSAGFDLVFSNSLIEHVGGHWRRKQMTEAVHRLADHHWVQTPSRYFPIEPHWRFPAFQFLPVSARAAISPRWPWASERLRHQPNLDALDEVLNIELVSTAEMRRLFPTSELYKERFAGMTKSVIAIR